MPARDSSATLGAAAHSVLCQTLRDFELIIVDDGSTDDTPQVIRSLVDPRMRVFHTGGRGVASARNLGIESARGEIVTFLDSDDEAHPEWLDTFRTLLSGESVSIVFCGANVEEPGRELAQVRPSDRDPIYGAEACLFLAGTYAVRRTLLEAAGGFDERLRYSENTELGIRLMSTCKAMGRSSAFVVSPLVTYRTRADRLDSERLDDRLEAIQLVLGRHLETFERNRPTAADWLTVAAVAAAQLGRLPLSRRLFVRAIAQQPLRLRNYGRLVVSLTPWLARRTWPVPGQSAGA